MSPASIVFPIPTSSATKRRMGSSLSAMSSGTSWYARGSTFKLPKLRNGPAPARSLSRRASRSRSAAASEPGASGFGGSKVAGAGRSGSSGR